MVLQDRERAEERHPCWMQSFAQEAEGRWPLGVTRMSTGGDGVGKASGRERPPNTWV